MPPRKGKERTMADERTLTRTLTEIAATEAAHAPNTMEEAERPVGEVIPQPPYSLAEPICCFKCENEIANRQPGQMYCLDCEPRDGFRCESCDRPFAGDPVLIDGKAHCRECADPFNELIRQDADFRAEFEDIPIPDANEGGMDDTDFERVLARLKRYEAEIESANIRADDLIARYAAEVNRRREEDEEYFTKRRSAVLGVYQPHFEAMLDDYEKTSQKRSRRFNLATVGRKRDYSWTLEFPDMAKAVDLGREIDGSLISETVLHIPQDHPLFDAVVEVLGMEADDLEWTPASVRLGEMKKRVKIDPVTKKVCAAAGHPVLETGEVAESIDLKVVRDEDLFKIEWR